MERDYDKDYRRRNNSMFWLSIIAVALIIAVGGIAYVLGTSQNLPNSSGVVPGIGGGPGTTPVPTETPTETPSPTPTPTATPEENLFINPSTTP